MSEWARDPSFLPCKFLFLWKSTEQWKYQSTACMCVHVKLVNVWEIISFPNIGKHGVTSGRSVKRVTIEIYLISHSRMSNQRSVSCRQSREKEENVLHQKFCFVVFFWKMWETLKLLHREREKRESLVWSKWWVVTLVSDLISTTNGKRWSSVAWDVRHCGHSHAIYLTC